MFNFFRKHSFVTILGLLAHFYFLSSWAEEVMPDGDRVKPIATFNFQNGSKLLYRKIEGSPNHVDVVFVDPSNSSRILFRGKLDAATVNAGENSNFPKGETQVLKKKSQSAALISLSGKLAVIDENGRTFQVPQDLSGSISDIKTSSRYTTGKYSPDTGEEYLGIILVYKTDGLISKAFSKGVTFVVSKNDNSILFAEGVHTYGEVTNLGGWVLVPFGSSIILKELPFPATTPLVPLVSKNSNWQMKIFNATDKIISLLFGVGETKSAEVKQEKPKRIETKTQTGSLVQVQSQHSENEYEFAKSRMAQEVVDQDVAIEKLVELRKQMDRGYSSRSHRVVLLDGTTGSGKTALAMSYAKNLQKSPDSIFEIDCTKYTDERAYVSALFGSDPGLVDSQKLTPFIEFLKHHKDEAVIVLNEFDKASVAFATKFMEIFDKGIINPSNGKPIILGKVLFVLTSNRNSEKIYPSDILRPLSREDLKKRILNMDEQAIKESYKQHASNPYDNSKSIPNEVLERLDGAVAVGPPSWEGAVEIVKNEFNIYKQIYTSRTGLNLDFDSSIFERVVDTSYVPQYGVRRLKRSFEVTFFKILDIIENEKKETDHVVRFVPDANTSGGNFIIENRMDSTSTTLYSPPTKSRKKVSAAHDPSERAILTSLEMNLSKMIIGQPEAIAAVVTSIQTKAANPIIKQPPRLLFVGPSGTGKSELAVAIAIARYGSENNFKRFVMGDVQTIGDLNNIFGSPRATHGSDSFAPFEQFIINNPNGAVALMDEIGNTVDSHVQDAMRKKFYEILDAGIWTSPSGKKYDVSKFFFLFTSNEGQEIVRDLPSDDLRMAAHKQVSDPLKITEYLKRQHKWPEALTNRFGANVVMARPLVKEHRPAIAKKLVLASVNSLAEKYEFKIDVKDSFYEKVGDMFYSHAKGARMIRDMANEAITNLVTKFVFDPKVDASLLANSRLTIEVRDNYDNLRFTTKNENIERKVTLLLTAYLPNGQTVNYDLDATRYASEVRVLNKQVLRRFAFHEAGHAIANIPNLTKREVEHINVESAGNYGGYTRFSLPNLQVNTRSSGVAEIAAMIAGGEAEVLAGFEKSDGWKQDFEMARKKAIEMVQNGMVGKPMTLPFDESGKILVQHPHVQNLISELLSESEMMAKSILAQRLPTLYMVASQLVRNQKLEKSEFNSIVSSAEKTEKQKQLLRIFKRNKKFNHYVPNMCRAFYSGL